MKSRTLLLFTAVCLVLAFPLTSNSQNPFKGNNLSKIKVRGTGQTTGHIADLTISNSSNEVVLMPSRTFFIPSSGRHQSYVGHIPKGVEVKPGETAVLEIEGICTDVYLPPVPAGVEMPSPDKWVFKEGAISFPESSFFSVEAEYRIIENSDGPIQLMTKAELIEKLIKLKSEGEWPSAGQVLKDDIPDKSDRKEVQEIVTIFEKEANEGSVNGGITIDTPEDSELVNASPNRKYMVDYASADLAIKVAKAARDIAEAAGDVVIGVTSEDDDDFDDDKKSDIRKDAVDGAADTAEKAGKDSEDASDEAMDAIAAAKAAKEKARSALEDADEARRLAREAADYAKALARRGEDKDGELKKKADAAKADYDKANDAYKRAKKAFEDAFGETVRGDKILPEPDVWPEPSGQVVPAETKGEAKPDQAKSPTKKIEPPKGLPLDSAARPPERATFSIDIEKSESGSGYEILGASDANYKKVKKDPELFGLNLIHAGTAIVLAADSMMKSGTVKTPFSGNPEKEMESIVQQTMWIYTAALSDKPYEKEDFEQRVYDQYAGDDSVKLDKATKEKLAPGVDAFWGEFLAVGLEAKVISVKEDSKSK